MEENKESQAIETIQYINEHGFIDNERAFEALRITRLGAVIWYIRHKLNIAVKDDWQYKHDSKGRIVKKWKRYWI